MHHRVGTPRTAALRPLPGCGALQAQCLDHAPVGVRKGVGVAGDAHRRVFRRPGPESRNLQETGAERFSVLEPIHTFVDDSSRNGGDRPATQSRHTNGSDLGVRQRPGVWKPARTESFAEFCRQVGRPGHAHLLAENGAYRTLERIPDAWNANARFGVHEGREPREHGEVTVDGVGLGVGVEQPAQPGDYIGRPHRR